MTRSSRALVLDVQLPARFSPSLSGTEDFPTHADWLLPLVDLVWTLPSGQRLVLDPWQRWLLRHMLEVYPEGHKRAGELRYRQVVVSMGRQNGKSVLGAILGLYGLAREAGALVIGIASSAEQARIIYARLLSVVQGNPTLAARFNRLTTTRGIQAKDGGVYEIKASKSAAVQGLDLSVGLCDELHLLKPELWSDMVNGTRARKNGVVLGITTAGDDNSTLLIDLYTTIENDVNERFGHFIWEAPEATVPKDDETFGEWLRMANPALACGRLDLETVIGDLRSQPDPDVIRYALNRFVSSTNTFLALADWLACGDEITPPKSGVVFAIDRTPDWTYATITAAWKDADGTICTEVVAALCRPTIEALVDLCVSLQRHAPRLFVADGYGLKGLVENLKSRGMTARSATLGDVTSAASFAYSKIKTQTLKHSNDALLTAQVPRAIRKNVGEAYKITRPPGGAEIDSLMATVLGIYFAETAPDIGSQLFV